MPKFITNNRALGVLILLLTIYAGFFFARPINLATADIGRHIVNGELILSGITDVLYSNHYSFTEQNHEFVNHHWGSGILFYLIHTAAGFKGLSIVYILLTLVALFLMGSATSIRNTKVISALVLATVIPLVAYRVEVRPEGFSYAILAGYFYLLSLFRAERISFKQLIIPLLSLQVLWVNLHIFFFLGIVASGAFLLGSLIDQNRSQTKNLLALLFGLIAASLINPHFHKGLLAPLTIFNEYGYMVAENQTILFMHERFGNPELFHFEIFAILTLLLIALNFYLGIWKQNIAEILLALTFVGLSAVAVRGIPLFALFFVPLSASVIQHYINGLNYKMRESILTFLPLVGIVFLVILIPLKGTYASAQKGYESIGLIEGINGCGEFLRSNQIPGKIFNNYDFGSYLIFHLHNEEKVFVDNRPEAYSVTFFDSIYKPMQQNEAIWAEKSLEYGINSIVFYRHDNTPWAQPFLISKTQDPEWVPIYVDEVSLILISNVASNSQWINKFALPREMFSGVPNK